MNQDNVYGTQVLTSWNGYQLLGIRNKPVGTDFDVSLDYLSKRGFGYGGIVQLRPRRTVRHSRPRGRAVADFWGIQDQGVDNLGQDRSAVPPEASYRYRLFWQHRELLPYDLQLSAELGWISDRNFLEEYYKSEWDELEGRDDRHGTETHQREQLLERHGRLPHQRFLHRDQLAAAGRPFLAGPIAVPRRLHLVRALQRRLRPVPAHDRAGKRHAVPVAPNPIGAAGPFNYLPWEQYQVQGERFATRQEIDWPFQLGVGQGGALRPGRGGPLGRGHQTATASTRLFWQAGVRASLPMWSVDPTVNSDLFNVHGIAHKVDFEAEFSYAQANQNLQEPAALRSAGRRLGRGLSAAVHDHHLRRAVDDHGAARRRRERS